MLDPMVVQLRVNASGLRHNVSMADRKTSQ